MPRTPLTENDMKDMLKNSTLALMAAMLCAAGGLGAEEKLTLQQAIQRALSGNPELAMDAPARAAAVSELAASRAGYLPRVDVEQSFLGGNNPVYVFGTLLTQRNFTAANFALPSLNTPDALKNLQTRVQAQQNIWDFGRTRQRVEGARQVIEQTDRGHDDHVRQTILAVVEAYYSVSLAGESLDAARAAVQSSESTLKQAQSRVESGLAVEADLLRSRAYAASARQQEIQAQGQREVARAVLNRLMGEPLDAQLAETAPLTPAAFPLPSEDSLLAGLQKHRPDYLRLQAELRQTELEVRGKQAQFLPTLGAFAAWEADNPSFREAGGSNWTAGLTLRWSLYAGGADAAMLHAARQRLEQKQLQIKAMESAMALEVHKALIQVRSAGERVKAMQSAEAESQEGLRILRNRYEAGLATMTDLLSAEAARNEARTLLAEAIFQHRVSYAQLQYAAGILTPDSAAVQ